MGKSKKLFLESPQRRRLCRKLCYFFKIFEKQSPGYISNKTSKSNRNYQTRKCESIPQFRIRHNFSKNFFFPSTVSRLDNIILDKNRLDKNIHNSDKISTFKTKFLKFVRPVPNSIFNCHHPEGAKSLTRLTLGLSRLSEHKFSLNFQDTLNPFCCWRNVLLEQNKKTAFLNNVNLLHPNIFDRSNLTIT